LLAAVHWQARSVSEQLVEDLTASERQVVAHAGICAVVRPESARIAKAENEYFIFLRWIFFF